MRKTAMVTGSGTGIGKRIAMALVDSGYDLGLQYRASVGGAKEVAEYAAAKGAKAVLIKGDISNMTELNRAFDEFFAAFGHIDLLVNNAAALGRASLLDASEEFFDQFMDTNIKGTFFCSQRAVRNMIDNKIKGVIVNITSVHQIGCWEESSIYAATKAAMLKFTMNWAAEMVGYGIRIVAVAPGYTVVEKISAESYENTRKMLPTRRWVQPEEIADAVVFLASDKAPSITGTCLMVDGGVLLPIYTEWPFRDQK